jgi:WD40 repeat protein
MLERARPEPGRPDLRGWEWHYLRGLREGNLHPGMRHSLEGWNFVHGLAVFPDGGRVATVAGYPAGYTDGRGRTNSITPGEMRVWDLKTGTCLLKRDIAGAAATAVAVRPDGNVLAFGDAKGNVQLLDLQSGERVPGPPALAHQVNFLAFSPDGRALAFASDLILVVWDCKEHRERFTAKGSWYFVRGAFRPGDALLVAVGRETNGVRAWELDSGKEISLPFPSERAHTLAFSPDRRLLALSRGKEIEIWDTDGSRLLRRLSSHTRIVEALAFGPEGRLASGSDDGSIRIWEAVSGQELMVLRGHKAGVTSLAFAAQGRQLVSADKEQAVRVWDVTHPPEGMRFQVGSGGRLGEWIGQLSFADEGRALLVEKDVGVEGKPRRLQRWDVTEARLVAEQPLSLGSHLWMRPSWDYVFSADGRRLASPVPDAPGTIRVVSSDDGAVLRTVQTAAAGISPVALTGDGKLLAYRTRPSAEGMGRAELCLVEVATGQLQARIELPMGRWVDSAAFSPDGRLLAGVEARVPDKDDSRTEPGGALVVWEADAGQEKQRIPVEPWVPRSCIVFSPDGRRLAAADRTGIVRVWDLAKRRLAFPGLRTATSLTGLAFSPDGSRLAAAGLDDRVRLYDAVAGHELLELRSLGMPGTGHYGYAARVAFSPDGKRIAANDWYGAVSVWSAGSPGR